MPLHRKPWLPEGFEGEVLGDDSPGQQRRMAGIERHTLGGQCLARGDSFGTAALGERDIMPSGEQVGFVPDALSMTQNDESAGHDRRLRTSPISMRTTVSAMSRIQLRATAYVVLAIMVGLVIAGAAGAAKYPERFDAKQIIVTRDGERGLRVTEVVDIDFGSFDRRGY